MATNLVSNEFHFGLVASNFVSNEPRFELVASIFVSNEPRFELVASNFLSNEPRLGLVASNFVSNEPRFGQVITSSVTHLSTLVFLLPTVTWDRKLGTERLSSTQRLEDYSPRWTTWSDNFNDNCLFKVAINTF